MQLKSILLLLISASTAWSQAQVFATGLQGPGRMIFTQRGNFLVTETSMALNAGRISLVSRSGTRRSLLEGLPSGIEVTLAGGSGPGALALNGWTLYVAMASGDNDRRGTPPGTSIHNSRGASSAVFATILEFRFGGDVDTLTETFRITPAQQESLADGLSVHLQDESGGTAQVSLLARFSISVPDRNTINRFTNLFGLLVVEDGKALYASDASRNMVVRVDTATGRWQRVANFGPVAYPSPVGAPMTDSVPTSINVYGDELLVSFLTGFPFAPGNARVLALNQKTGVSTPFIFGLTSVTDVLWRTRPDGRSQFFILEFSSNQSAAQPPPGRLLRFDSGHPVVAAAGLITPVCMVLD